MDVQAQLFGFLIDEGVELAIISLGHVWKPHTEALIIRTAERIRALQVDVIADHHQAALRIIAIDTAGGSREDDCLNAQARENADGERYFLYGISFVEMHAALHSGHGDIANLSDDQLAGVADGCRAREVRDSCVGNFRGVTELVCKISQPGAEN